VISSSQNVSWPYDRLLDDMFPQAYEIDAISLIRKKKSVARQEEK